MILKPKCENNDITTIRKSLEAHLHSEDHFHKNPLYFRIYADFEAENAIHNSETGDKATDIYKQNPVLNGNHIESERKDVLRSGNYKSP